MRMIRVVRCTCGFRMNVNLTHFYLKIIYLVLRYSDIDKIKYAQRMTKIKNNNVTKDVFLLF